MRKPRKEARLGGADPARKMKDQQESLAPVFQAPGDNTNQHERLVEFLYYGMSAPHFSQFVLDNARDWNKTECGFMGLVGGLRKSAAIGPKNFN